VSNKKIDLVPHDRHERRVEKTFVRKNAIVTATASNIDRSPDKSSLHQSETSSKVPGCSVLDRADRDVEIARVGGKSRQIDRDNWPIAIHRSQIGNMQLVEMQWQAVHTLERNPVEADYTICIPISGRIEWQDVRYPAVDLAIASAPSRPFPGIASANGRVSIVGFDRHSIDRLLVKLLDREVKQPLVFEPTIDLANEFGASLKATIEFLGRSRTPDRHITSPMIQAELEGALLTCLLKGVRHNYADEILYRCQGAFACYVKQASLYIEAHLQDEIDLADISAAVNISPRLLQKAFAQECDCSPMRFVTRMRLERIRQELVRASDTTTRIIDVMMSYGITQGGKFAKDYQQLFGEKPSDTLKRASLAARPFWQEIDDACSEQIVGGVVISDNARNQSVPSPILLGDRDPVLWAGYLRSIGIDLTTQIADECDLLGIN
jgi:AraC-like DNA-binding protein